MQSELVTDGRAALLHIECFYEADDAEKRIKAVLAVFDEAERLHKEVAGLKLLVEESLFHLRLDERAELYHHKALAALTADNQEQP